MTDDLHDLVAGYALNALTSDERVAFEAHLSDCPTCREELAGFREVVAEWGSDYAVEPPASLRANVLDAVAQLPAPQASEELVDQAVPEADATGASVTALPVDGGGLSPAVQARTERNRPQRSTAGPKETLPSGPRPAHDSRQSRWRVLVAAAIAVIVAIGISVWQPWAPRTITAADVLAAPDAVRATVAAEGGTATLVRSNVLARAVLITKGMPPPSGDTVHQAWLIHPSGTVTSAGLMADEPDQTMLLEGDARDVTAAGISVEPPGGSQQPTKVIVQIKL